MTERELAARIASRFESRWLQGYVRGKLRSDAVYREVFPRLASSSRPLLDLGCGVGVLALYLRQSGVTAPILGIDFDARKIDAARGAAQPEQDIEFRVGDVRERIDFRGNVAMLDVLHYFSNDDQRTLLRNAAEYVSEGGVILIRECLRDASWRYRLTYLEEFFATSIGWLRGERLNFPTLALIRSELSPERFEESVRPLWGATPFNNHLLVYSTEHERKSLS